VRIAKWIAIIVGSLVLLLAGTAFVMTSLIDPNRYRGKVEAIVGDLTGRPLVIEGDLRITWFPWLGVSMGYAHLDNRPGVVGPPIAEWRSVAAAAKVFPLLRGEVVIDRIRLQSPHIRLRRDAQGHGNWEDLGPRGPSPASRPSLPSSSGLGAPSSPGSKEPSPPRSGAQSPPRPGAQSSPSEAGAPLQSRRGAPPQIAGLEVRDATLEYVDEVSGLQVNLSGLELDVGEWRVDQSLPVHTRFLAHSDSLPATGLWVHVDAPELTVRLEPLNVEIPKLAVRVADAQIKGSLVCETLAEGGLLAHGSIALQVPSVRQLAHNLALDQTLPHDPTTLGPLELTGDWTYGGAGALTAKPLALKLDGVTFDGWVERSAPPQSAWRFELHGDRIDLGRYINVDSKHKKPFELPVEALRALNANGSLVFDHAQLADTQLTDVRLRLQTPEPGYEAAIGTQALKPSREPQP